MKTTVVGLSFLIWFLVQSSAPNSLACMTDASFSEPKIKTEWTTYGMDFHKLLSSDKTNAGGIENQTTWSRERPWGGPNSSAWRPEAVVANAASDALAHGLVRSGVKEVLVSIPVKMLYGTDGLSSGGNTNAALTLGSLFRRPYPPLIASWLIMEDGSKLLIVHVRGVAGLIPNQPLMIDFGKNTPPLKLILKAVGQNNEFEALWQTRGTPWGNLYENHPAYLKLPGMSGWFPIDFRDVVRPAEEVLANFPEGKQRLGKGTVLDPEQVSAQGNHWDLTPFKKMYPNTPNPSCRQGCAAGPHDFGADIHAVRYSPEIGVFNYFTFKNSTVVTTAVGNADTTLIGQPPALLTMAYACFDRRNLSAEEHFGVASGIGWHELGDDADTVFNTLENSSFLIGYANGKPGDDRPYAFGLSDVTVFRKLRPGAAFITANGPTTAREGHTPARGKGPANGRNYHWFAFDQSAEVCMMGMIFPCAPTPSNHLGLQCQK